MLSESIDVGVVRQRRLDTQILGLEHQRSAGGVEEGFTVARPNDRKAERRLGILEADVGIPATSPRFGTREDAFWDLVASAFGVGDFDMDSIIYRASVHRRVKPGHNRPTCFVQDAQR